MRGKTEEAFLSVETGVGPAKLSCSAGFDALWSECGAVQVNGETSSGPNTLLRAGDHAAILPANAARWVRFSIRFDMEATSEGRPIQLPYGPFLLRLDEVKFPPGAVAYRHVHPGPGFRVLTAGALRIRGDEHMEEARPGHIWFEPAYSPVRAEASKVEPITGFVRFMVLPAAFHGQPTIRVLDPEDAALPRLQRTHRHIDELIQLSSPG